MGANQSKRKSTSSTASKVRSPSRHSARSPPISSSSPTTQHKPSLQPLQRPSSTSYTSPSSRSSSPPPATPVLIDDDEEEEQQDDQTRRRISIEFYSDDASILIKSRIIENSNVSDNLPDEEYFPATLSSISSSSTSSLASALFSTASSPSSLSTISTRSAKKFAPSASPALSRVLAEQPSTQGLVNRTSANDEVVWRIQVAQDNILGERKDPVKIQHAYLDLERMAQMSIVESYYPLGVCYYRGSASDERKAVHWLSLAIKEGDKRLKQGGHSDLLYTHVARANYCLGEIFANKSDKALPYLQTAAQMGHATAQHIMGHRYQYDDVDLDRASAWYELAAQQGYGKAQAALGALLLEYPDHWAATAATRDQVVQTAIGWLNLAANQGNVRAALQLAYLYEEGKLVRRNKQKAFEFYKRYYADESRPNYATAHYLMGIAYRDGDVDLPQDHALAFRHLNLSAKAGSPLAHRVLGVMYMQGIGVSVDEERAHGYFQSAAKLGDLLSYGWLGKQYEYGRGCNRNVTEAIRCYEKASHEPSIAIPSHLALALLYDRLSKHSQALVYFQRVANTDMPNSVTALDSKLVTYQLTARLKIAIYQAHGLANLQRDPVAAFQTFIDLSENNNFPDAHIAIGDTFRQGLTLHGRVIIPVDLKRACSYYEKAAKMDDVTAQFKLADILSNTIRDRTRAFTWYARAAQQGHALAQYCQALYYLRGLEPAKKDSLQAQTLLEQAAEQGLTDAMVSLAQLLLQNRPSGSDNYQAFTWLHKAASRNDPAALRELAAAYENGNVPVDNQQARHQAGFQLLQIATSKNDARSWYAMARYYENGWSVEANAGEALRCLEKAEQLGYSRASLAIADMYERNSMRDLAFSKYAMVAAKHDVTSAFGWHARISRAKLVVLHEIGTNKDRAEIYALLCDMAKLGTTEQKADIFELLGICFEHGIGVQGNTASAIKCYQQAIELDVSQVNWSQERARARLAKLYMTSDPERAVNCLLELAPKLDEMKAHQNVSETVTQAREARYLLGHMYLHAQGGVAKDYVLAKKWLGEAADQAHGAAAFELGILELEQDNEREAKHRFIQGDTIGHAGCKRELAMLLYREHLDDIHWDGSEVKDLLEDAEQLGDIEATIQLGKLHEKGLQDVIRPHRETALMYYVRAANRGHVDAMICAAESYDAIKRYREAAAWFKKIQDKRVSQIMLASYRIQGLGGIPREEKKGFSQLLDIMETWDNPIDESEIRAFGVACIALGECYEYGRGTAQDKDAAKLWYERGSNDAKNSEAMVRLARLAEDPVTALELHRRAAEEGKNKEAQYQVGLCHKEGLAGLDKNLVAARRYLSKAAEQGHPLAAFELGNVLTDMGEYQNALRWFEKAGSQMVPEALRTLGLLYHCGFSSPTKKKGDVFIIVQDYKRAYGYFLKASELGDETATMMVGSYFQEGYHPDFGVDYNKALQWYETAYKISHSPVVELVIGKLRHTQANETSNPEQVESLRKEAYHWFIKAAQAEDGVQVTDAKTMVALYHLNGWGGVEPNSKLGFEQLLSLAKEGVTQVFEEVARCYEEGIGVEKNQSKALSYWMDLAMAGDKTGLERVREYHRLGLATAQELKSAEDSFNLATDHSSSHHDQSIPSSSSSSSLYSA